MDEVLVMLILGLGSLAAAMLAAWALAWSPVPRADAPSPSADRNAP